GIALQPLAGLLDPPVQAGAPAQHAPDPPGDLAAVAAADVAPVLQVAVEDAVGRALGGADRLQDLDRRREAGSIFHFNSIPCGANFTSHVGTVVGRFAGDGHVVDMAL